MTFVEGYHHSKAMASRGYFVCDVRDNFMFHKCRCWCDAGRNLHGHGSFIKYESGRIISFPRHSLPYDDTTINDLARYGFKWGHDGSKLGFVSCVYCEIKIEDWDRGKRAFTEHLKLSPSCIIVVGHGLECDCSHSYECHVAVHDSSKVSYIDYPADWKYPVEAEDLERYGFKWVGEGDCVKCPSCNLKVKNWQESDLAAAVHYKYSPTCSMLGD